MIKVLLRVEYGFALLFVFFMYVHIGFSVWLFFLLLLVPDVTMLGYLVNSKVGAIIYNIGHSFMIPIILCSISIGLSNQLLLMITLLWFAHISMDRCLGYGLKYKDSFKETHMQKV